MSNLLLGHSFLISLTVITKKSDLLGRFSPFYSPGDGFGYRAKSLLSCETLALPEIGVRVPTAQTYAWLLVRFSLALFQQSKI